MRFVHRDSLFTSGAPDADSSGASELFAATHDVASRGETFTSRCCVSYFTPNQIFSLFGLKKTISCVGSNRSYEDQILGSMIITKTES